LATPAQNQPPPAPLPRGEGDLTGRERIFSNILHSWGGYLIVFLAGFIMPRLIDQNVGQVGLGVWDFSWSFVNYMRMTMLGLGSSVNRYVARYRAVQDTDRLNQTVSTVMILQINVAVLVLSLSALLAWLLPHFFQDRLGDQTSTARWVVFFLGAALSVSMLCDTSRGVITGCHRWDLHNLIHSSAQLTELLCMLMVFSCGGGLRALSVVVLAVESGAGLSRTLVSRRICPELHTSLSFFRAKIAKEVYRFGAKTFIFGLPPLILVQTTNMFVVGTLGPAALAVFSRSLALVRHVETFIGKFAFILAPTAGSLQSLGNQEELRRFFLSASRYGVAFTMPILLLLILYGDLVLNLWMGTRYTGNAALMILALGYFLPISQSSVREVLTGLNQHGKIGLFTCCLSLALFIAGSLFFIQAGWTLNRAAILLALCLGLGIGIAPAYRACNSLNVPYIEYLRSSFAMPACCNAAFVLCLAAFRFLLGGSHPIIVLILGSSLSGIVLLALYLRYVFPAGTWAGIIARCTRSTRT